MQKSKVSTMSRRTVIIAVLALLTAFLLFGCSQTGGNSDSDHSDNTVILSNPDAPDSGDPDISAIAGYTEKTVDGITTPAAVTDFDLDIVSVGSFSGRYIEDRGVDNCENIPAIIVRNKSDKVVSYADISVLYGEGDDDITSFIPTSIPAGCSALVLASDKELTFDKVKAFRILDMRSVTSDALTMLDGEVGVSYSDGAFFVTNLTDEKMGEVYVRYKYITPGNCYFGGITFSVNTEPLPAHKTQKLYASFDVGECVIVAVETVDD